MARRILLLIDDFNENRRIEGILRKVGFDCVGIQTDASLHEQILAFGPDIVVASGSSPKLSALNVANKLKEHRTFHGQVVLAFPAGQKLTSQDLLKARVDRILDAPFRPEALIQAIAQLLRMDGSQLVEKFKKFNFEEGDKVSDLKIVKGKVAAEPVEHVKDLTREERYRRILKQTHIDKNATTFTKNSVREHWKEVKKGWNMNLLEDLKRLKTEFAKALFRKK